MDLRAQYPVTLVRGGGVDPRAKWFTPIYEEIRQQIPTRLIRLLHPPVPSLAPSVCRLQMRLLERRDTITHIPTNSYSFLIRKRPRSPTVITCFHVGSRESMQPIQYADRVIISANQLRAEIEPVVKLRHEPEVVYCAVPPSYRPADLPREPHQILYVGTEQSRKNIDGLFRMFARVLQQQPATLVKVGSPGPDRPRLRRLAQDLKIDKNIVWIDYLVGDPLIRLYQTSTVVAIPSFLEGFSMPCLEAMSTGCPLIASNLTAIPEVVANGGILLDPRDEPAWAEAILRVFQEPAFARDLSARGIERSHFFSARKSAEQTLRIYGEVWEERGGR